jgi:hypothetical protein
MAIEGNLQDMSLVDIIQLSCRSLEASAVSLKRGDRKGSIYFDEGQVLHAVYEDEQGQEAFFQLLKWEDADFVIEKGVESPDRSIHINWKPLLMQCLQRIDEDRHNDQESDEGRTNEDTLRELADRLDNVVAIFALDGGDTVLASLLEDELLDTEIAVTALSGMTVRIQDALSASRAGAFEENIIMTSQYRFITRPIDDGQCCVHLVLNGNGNIGAARMHLAAYLALQGKKLDG